MNTLARFVVLLVAMLLVVSIVACGGGSPTATPQPPTSALPTLGAPTSAPATVAQPTTAPPTEAQPTAAQPTAAQPTTAPATSATGGSAGGTGFAEALQNAKSASTYRIDMQLSATGALAGLGGGTGDVPSGLPLMTMKGMVKDKDSDLKMGGLLIGFLTGFLGFAPAEEVEFLSVGGKSFIMGKRVGDTEAKWYTMTNSESMQTPVSPETMLESFQKANIDPSAFQKKASQPLDNMNCDVYSGDKDAVIKAFQTMGTSTQSDFDPSTVDQAQLDFFICNDGFLHQVQMNLAMHDKDKPDQKSTFELLFHIFDINAADIKIEEPANAQPLPAPSFGGETETPTATP